MFKLFRALKKHEEFEETKEVPREGVKEIETSQSYANTVRDKVTTRESVHDAPAVQDCVPAPQPSTPVMKKHEEFEETKEVPREGMNEIETSHYILNTLSLR